MTAMCAIIIATHNFSQELFEEAMELVGSEFTGRLMSLKEHWLPARELVQNAFQERFNVSHCM